MKLTLNIPYTSSQCMGAFLEKQKLVILSGGITSGIYGPKRIVMYCVWMKGLQRETQHEYYSPIASLLYDIIKYIIYKLNKLKLIIQLMNLTLNTHSRASKMQKGSSPSQASYLLSNEKRQQPQLPFYSNCPNFVFGNCVRQSQRISTQQNEIIENYEKQRSSLKKDAQNMRCTKLVEQQSNRKYKICLSLRQSEQKYQTPKKRALKSNHQTKSYSENKQTSHFKKQHQQKEKEKSNSKKVINLKIKTEPVEEGKYIETNIHQLKESLKPSTNIMTPVSKSMKQSNNSTSKKVQLTISNNFKSSMAQQKKQVQQKASTNFLTVKRLQPGPGFVSQQVFVEQSFMTAKLHNIYGEIHNSFLQHPSSNIVYYNQMMANEVTWKHPQPVMHSQQNCEIIRKQPKEGQSQTKKRVAIKNTSILQNAEDEQEEQRVPGLQENQKVDIRQKFMERKYIGQYAKTIKTFNQSEFKSEHQSVVLEHGIPFQGGFQPFLINRGSIKEYPRQSESQIIRRQCNSFGEQHQNSYQIVRDRYREYVSHPIQQSSYQAERQN